jgi:uncharacterized protein (UPF0548 family)
MASCPGTRDRGGAFVVELHDDGRVTLTNTAFARPSWLLARLASPVSRAIKAWITRRCLTALKA